MGWIPGLARDDIRRSHGSRIESGMTEEGVMDPGSSPG
jgi:hypothetical protein